MAKMPMRLWEEIREMEKTPDEARWRARTRYVVGLGLDYWKLEEMRSMRWVFLLILEVVEVVGWIGG